MAFEFDCKELIFGSFLIFVVVLNLQSFEDKELSECNASDRSLSSSVSMNSFLMIVDDSNSLNKIVGTGNEHPSHLVEAAFLLETAVSSMEAIVPVLSSSVGVSSSPAEIKYKGTMSNE